MKSGFRLGDFELTWLNGGRFALDGGAMFGVVPKALWQKKYPGDEQNAIPLSASPVLVKADNSLILVETGLGNKLTEKQRQIYKVREDWNVINDLKALGIERGDITTVILTHYDFDHAGGVVMQNTNGRLELTFPKAGHIIQKKEWEDVLNPNMRSINTYWPVNNELLRNSKNLELVAGSVEIVKGIQVILTGGHNRGHQIVRLESKSQVALHLADLLPTHAHFNPLWVMAYDNFPLESITRKEEWETFGVREGAWFTFYHDAFVLACKFDEKGDITEKWEND